MTSYKQPLLLVFFLCALSTSAYPQGIGLDVLSYNLTIEPNIQKKYVEGTVLIHLKKGANENTIILDAGALEIEEVTGANVKSFQKKNSQLIIELSDQGQSEHKLSIRYHGYPKKGLLFNPDLEQAHTVYFTNQWMVCHDQPDDKATFEATILVPKGKQCIASGVLIRTEDKEDKTHFQWSQKYETPPYTYGFVIGAFNQVSENIGDVDLHYFSAQRSEVELKKIFEATGEILEFLEEKSGVKYLQKSYSQILIGSNYQEMSGLAVFNTTYAAAVLKDSSEIHLTAHELAHQWWGNSITCRSFGHFWLNEAFAVYLATAFNEYKFGPEKYRSDIAIYKSIYDGLVKNGNDKPLVFDKWIPSRANRNVVYYKGAYVLHLLRQELGDQAFWKAIKAYSQQYFGKTVDTNDFQISVEQSTGLDLDVFFDKWVYGSQNK